MWILEAIIITYSLEIPGFPLNNVFSTYGFAAFNPVIRSLLVLLNFVPSAFSVPFPWPFFPLLLECGVLLSSCCLDLPFSWIFLVSGVSHATPSESYLSWELCSLWNDSECMNLYFIVAFLHLTCWKLVPGNFRHYSWLGISYFYFKIFLLPQICLQIAFYSSSSRGRAPDWVTGPRLGWLCSSRQKDRVDDFTELWSRAMLCYLSMKE